MEIRQLKQFKVVAEQESIRKASEILYISSSGLVKVIANLEDELGCTLFNRIKKRIHLNDNGRLLLEYANKICSLEDELKEVFQGKLASKKIKILSYLNGATYFCFYKMDLSNLSKYDISHNLVDNSSLKKLLYSGEYDLLIDYDNESKNTEYKLKKFLCCEEVCCVAVPKNHPWFHKKYLTRKDIEGSVFISRDDEKDWIEKSIADYNLKITIDYVHHTLYSSIINKNDTPVFHCGQVPFLQVPYTNKNYPYKRLVVRDLKPRAVYLWYLPEEELKAQPVIDNLKKVFTTKEYFI